MPQSLSLVLLHVIFSTKDRTPFLTPTLRPKLHAYLATVTRNLDCDCFLVGGIDDHVHLAIGLSRTITLAKLVEQMKTSSSKFLKTDVPNFVWAGGAIMGAPFMTRSLRHERQGFPTHLKSPGAHSTQASPR